MKSLSSLSHLSFRFLALALAPLSLFGAGTLLDESFEGRQEGVFRGASANGSVIKVWSGPPEGPFGSFELVRDADLSKGLALAVRDMAAERERAPALVLEWARVAAESKLGVVVEFKYKVIPPAPGPDGAAGRYRADIHVGGAWKNAICNVILENGQIRLHDGSSASVAGRYVPNQWQTLRLEISSAEKTFDLSVDGRLLANGYPWVNHSNPGLGNVTIKADMAASDRSGETVLLLSELSVVVKD